MSFRPYALVGLLVSPKRDQKSYRGPRDKFEGRTQKFGQFSVRTPAKRRSGGGGGFVRKGGQQHVP